MNYADIETFLIVYKTKSLSRAADVLFLTQSTVSHRLKSLENALGFVLVNRNKGGKLIELTRKGKEFLPIAEKWNETWSDTQRFKESTNRLYMSIASVDSLVTYTFSSFFDDLVKTNFPLDLSIKVYNSSEIYAMIERHEIDVGLVLQYIPLKNVIVQPLMTETMYLVRKHESKTVQSVHPRELERRNEIFLNWSVEFSLWHDFWFDKSVRPHLTVSTIPLMITALENKGYWAIVPESIANYLVRTHGCERLTIEESPPQRTIYLIKASHPSAESSRCTQILQEVLEHYL